MRLTPYRQVANPRGEQSPEGDASVLLRFGFARGSTGGRQRHEGHRAREGAKASRGGKALEGKPHERYRHETRPEGAGGRKPAGGRETLKSEGVG